MAPPDLALLGLLLAGLAGGAEAGAEPAPVGPAWCSLQPTADPPSLEPGDGRTVHLRVKAPARPRLAASVGRVEGLRAAGEGAWEADWIAPPAGVPRVGLVTALSAGQCGHLAVPLTGSGDAVVRTRPGASVVVRIGERPFGPAVADADGVALVPVEVPPGVDAVFHGLRRIPFPIPPVAHVALAAEVDEAPADREVEVALLLVASDAAGGPRTGPAPALEATAGRLGPPVPAGPGAWRVTWRLPAGPAEAATVTARLPGEPGVALTVARPVGVAARAELRLASAAASPDDGPLALAVALRDAAGNPADDALTLTADAGEVAPPERLEAGSYRSAWTPPSLLEGRRKAVLVARAGAAETSATVALRPGAPARLTLGAEPPEVTADGRAEAVILAGVEDRHSNPVDEPPTSATALAGALGPPRPVGPGRFQLAYRPPALTSWGEDEVTAALPPLSTSLRLRLRPPTPPLAVAASAGLALRPGGWLGLQAGAEASAWRWLLGQESGLALAAVFSRFREDRAVAVGATTIPFTGELRALALLASAAWRRAAGRAVPVRLEAGAGLGRVESRVSAGGGPDLPEAAWVPALSAAASVGWPAWRGRALLELRATWLRDAHLASLRGAASPLSLSLGYELDAR